MPLWLKWNRLKFKDNNGQYQPIAVFGENIVPKAPSTDGTYVLKVTVLNGVATYSWVAEQND